MASTLPKSYCHLLFHCAWPACFCCVVCLIFPNVVTHTAAMGPATAYDAVSHLSQFRCCYFLLMLVLDSQIISDHCWCHCWCWQWPYLLLPQAQQLLQSHHCPLHHDTVNLHCHTGAAPHGWLILLLLLVSFLTGWQQLATVPQCSTLHCCTLSSLVLVWLHLTIAPLNQLIVVFIYNWFFSLALLLASSFCCSCCSQHRLLSCSFYHCSITTALNFKNCMYHGRRSANICCTMFLLACVILVGAIANKWQRGGQKGQKGTNSLGLGDNKLSPIFVPSWGTYDFIQFFWHSFIPMKKLKNVVTWSIWRMYARVSWSIWRMYVIVSIHSSQ